MTDVSDETLRRWLLHRLPSAEAEALEQRLLTDAAFGERLRAVETDLLDDLARDRLDAGDRAAAAEHLAGTPKDRERLRIALALARAGGAPASVSRDSQDDRRTAPGALPHRHARGSPRRRRTAVAAVLAAACAVAVVVGLRIQRTGTAPASTDNAGVESTITLLASRQRGVQAEEIRIPRAVATLRLQAELDGGDAGSRYTLSIDDGTRTEFTAADLAPREIGAYRFVEVRFAAKTLRGGSHTVRLVAQGTTEPASTWSLTTHLQ